MGHFLYNLPRFSAAVWHTQRMANFVTIFRWRFFAPVWHSLKHVTLSDRCVNFCKVHVRSEQKWTDQTHVVKIVLCPLRNAYAACVDSPLRVRHGEYVTLGDRCINFCKVPCAFRTEMTD